MSWLIQCPVSKEQSDREAARTKGLHVPYIHEHVCKNGPDNVRPDLHVCETCGAVFQQEMKFGP